MNTAEGLIVLVEHGAEYSQHLTQTKNGYKLLLDLTSTIIGDRVSYIIIA